MITGKITRDYRQSVEITIPEGYYVDDKDSAFRHIHNGESGIDKHDCVLKEWVFSDETIDVYIPIKKIPAPKDISSVSLAIHPFDIYPEHIKIPAGYEQRGFHTVKKLYENNIEYFLSVLGEVRCTTPHMSDVRIGLKKI